MASLGLRHAGDTPVEGFIWRKSPFAGPLGGRREACWVGGCGAGGRRQGWEGSGRPTGGRREACWVGWLRCRWVAAGPGRASRSTTPSEARVWRSRGRAAAHRRTEQPRARRRGQASRRTEVWRREAAQSSRVLASRAHAELGRFRLRSVTARCSRTHAPGPAMSTRRSGSDRPEQAGSPRTCAATPRENRRCVRA